MTPKDTKTDSMLRGVASAPPVSPPAVTGMPQLGDRYAIEREIGRGGMGRVFLAHDRRLGRDVAIKVIAPGAHGEDALLRFEQEARAAGSLAHANIVTVFDVETAGGAPYIVSEYLRGATLRQRLAGKPLAVAEALEYAGQLAQGLLAAHEKGVIHRDLKPDNLFVTDEGRLKILDFGIAKLVDSPAEEAAPPHSPSPHTETGAILGTVGYMSPEQVRGEPTDRRSDLFSVGAILYEMLAGQRAFARKTPVETNYAILHAEPPPVPAQVPPELDGLVRRCLEKDPDKRFQSAHELALQLAQVAGGAARAPPPRRARWRWAAAAALVIAALVAAVLLQRGPTIAAARITVAAADFVNETKEEELNGLSGMLITSLEQSKRLSVLTRGRMFDILKQLGRADAERIDEQLGREICKHASVGALVLASIRRFGDLYAIDLKVLDPIKNEHLFTASEQGKGKESIPAMIDRLSERTRAGLHEKADEIRAASVGVAQSITANLEAYQHYFQGEQWRARGLLTKARDELGKAIQLDPKFGLAHFALGIALSSNRDRPKAVEAFETALRLGLPEQERCVAGAELAGSRGEGDRALELIDGCAARFAQDKSVLYSAALWRNVNPAGAAPYLERVVAIDPTFQPAVGDLIEVWQELGKADKALELAKDYAARVHDVESRVQLASAQLFVGQRAPAFETLHEAARLFPQSANPAFELARAYLFSGEPEKAEAELKPVIEGRFAEAGPDAASAAGTLLDVYGGRFKSAAATFDAAAARARKAGSSGALGWKLFWKGIMLAQGPGDLAAARSVAAELEAIDVAADFPFLLYCVIGDVDRAAAIAATRPAYLFDLQPYCDAQRARKRGALAEAIERFEKLAPILSHGDQSRYLLIELNLAAGEPRKALAAARRLQTTYRTEPAYLFFPMWYPRSFYRLGQVYERLGDARAALQAYERFLALWKDADPDLEELRDAKARALALRDLVRK